LPWACAVLAALLGARAHADVSSCTLSASGVFFGTYTPATPAPLTGTGTINLTCTVTTKKNTLTIDLSPGSSGSYATRTLRSGTDVLNYNLYLDAADTQVWGDGTGGSVVDSVPIMAHGNGSQASATFTIYGAIAALQDPAAGGYTDTITVTVNF
jgi:spore coat protein U-like protein